MKYAIHVFLGTVFLVTILTSSAVADSPPWMKGLPCDVQWTPDPNTPGDTPGWNTVLSDGRKVTTYEKDGTRYIEIITPNGYKVIIQNTPPSSHTSIDTYLDGELVNHNDQYMPWIFIILELCFNQEYEPGNYIPKVTQQPLITEFLNLIDTNYDKGLHDSSRPHDYVTGFFDHTLTCIDKGLWWAESIDTDSDPPQYYWYHVYRSLDGSEITLKRYTDGSVDILIIEPDGTIIEIQFFENDIGYSIYGRRTDITVTVTKDGKTTTSYSTDDWDDFLEFYICGKKLVIHPPGRYDLVTRPLTGLTGLSAGEKPDNEEFPNTDCQQPDLKWKQLTVPDMGTTGTEIQISATVMNTGSFPSGEIPVGVHLSQGQNMLYLLEKIPSLQPGESRDITFIVTVPDDTEGIGILTIILDPDGTENECNENNNEKSADFRVLPAGVSPKDYISQTTGAGTKITGSTGSGGGGGGVCCPDCWC